MQNMTMNSVFILENDNARFLSYSGPSLTPKAEPICQLDQFSYSHA